MKRLTLIFAVLLLASLAVAGGKEVEFKLWLCKGGGSVSIDLVHNPSAVAAFWKTETGGGCMITPKLDSEDPWLAPLPADTPCMVVWIKDVLFSRKDVRFQAAYRNTTIREVRAGVEEPPYFDRFVVKKRGAVTLPGSSVKVVYPGKVKKGTRPSSLCD